MMKMKYSKMRALYAHIEKYLKMGVDPQFYPITLACFLRVSLAPSLIDMGLGPFCLVLLVFEPPVSSPMVSVQCVHLVHFEVPSWSNPWVVLCYRIEMRPL